MLVKESNILTRQQENNQNVNLRNVEPINRKLRKHEERVVDWLFQFLVQRLYKWFRIFNVYFKLKLPQVVITFNKIRRGTYATYQEGRSGLGTKYTITFNVKHLKDKYYRILRRLLHECIHCWQEIYGKSRPRTKSSRDLAGWYHNKQFIDKAMSCGILTNHRGYDLGHNEIFSTLLIKYGVDVPESETEDMADSDSDEESNQDVSTLKKWSCGCTNVWCAVDLNAQCLECGGIFKKENR